MPYFWSPQVPSIASPASEKKRASSSTLSLPARPETGSIAFDDFDDEFVPSTPSAPAVPSSALLPPPVTASNHGVTATGSSHNGQSSSHPGFPRRKKSARIEQGLRVHWARFKRRIGTPGDAADGEAPSESLLESAQPSTDTTISSGWGRQRTAELALERMGPVRRNRDVDIDGDADVDGEPVDEVVVDRAWAWPGSAAGEHMDTDTVQSEVGSSANGIGNDASRGGASRRTGGRSVSGGRDSPPHPEGFWGVCLPLAIVRWRLWPSAIEFFSSRFYDNRTEIHYRKEIWFSSKVRISPTVMICIYMYSSYR